MEKIARVPCQRIGCYALFSDDDNTDGSCTYHDSIVDDHSVKLEAFFLLFLVLLDSYLDPSLRFKPKYYLFQPIFHDGTKEWSCCKKRSHDFSLFLALPGVAQVFLLSIRCKTGKHTTEKPVITRAAASPRKPVPAPAPSTDASSKLACSRCRQGFFCSEHGSQPREVQLKPVNAAAAPAESNTDVQKGTPTPKEIVDLNQPQTCRNKGCGRTFKEKDNNDSACNYHPGPAVFHDRMRGWKCCNIHVTEFDDFMNIPPCTKGWHNANPVP
ncbi:hypothetical protein HHK36_027889 [Tetracentron sinense]|uniref:CHORD domain-containing protein n=1 Tax=Tetracentron sinense TaxID=13715 RepID=A0A834YER9_TETSI|nr:hypothetical protein HHK36_027889 [Tetracentron sinense]